MIAAPARQITAADLIGARVERLARYGAPGVGAVVAAEANSFCGFVMEVILEDGRRDRNVRFNWMFDDSSCYRFIMTDKADPGEIDQLIAGAESKELLAEMARRAKVSNYAAEMAKIAHEFDGIVFLAYAVKKGGMKARVHYSAHTDSNGRKCVTIYSKDYDRALGEIFAAGYKNDTDTMTDYFDKGRVTIYEGHPLYEKAMERVKMNDAAFDVRQEKKKTARAERANARFYR